MAEEYMDTVEEQKAKWGKELQNDRGDNSGKDEAILDDDLADYHV